jgi:hypothetical protein
MRDGRVEVLAQVAAEKQFFHYKLLRKICSKLRKSGFQAKSNARQNTLITSDL